MLPDSGKKPPLLQVKNLKTSFHGPEGWIPVVNGVSFELGEQETLGIIGESGSGKTITSLSIMRLIPKPMGKIESGSVALRGEQLLEMPIEQFRPLRGKKMAMIFQDPMTSLNPVLTIGRQLFEVLALGQTPKAEWEEKAAELLTQVGIADPKRQLHAYPHQLSGGMKQRVMIAMALAQDPEILIADEPTTALDVTIQAQILKLLKELQAQRGMSILLITHDLGVVAQTCDQVLVMYGGQIVEKAPVAKLFENPQHPYTQGLMASIQSLTETGLTRLKTIPGMVPQPGSLPPGCAFQNRCAQATERCQIQPSPQALGEGHWAACHFAKEGA